MSDIKKRVLDLLFESDNEEVAIDAPLKDLTTNKKKESSTSLKAKDVLYGNSEFNPSFIDYEPKPIIKKAQKEEKYEMHSNISPIFGPLSEAKTAKAITSEIDTKKATESKTTNEYSGVVISPIYGYDSSKANSARGNLKPDLEKIKNDLDIFDDEPFDMQVDSFNETIKEAVQEAVIEFNPVEKKDEFTTDDVNIYDTLENRLDDIMEKNHEGINTIIDSANNKIIEENNRQEEIENEPSIKKHSELVNNYATLLETGEFPKVQDENVELKKEIVDETNNNKEINESFEDAQDKLETRKRKALKSNETEQESNVNENISLFDFDDVVNDSKDNDIFDELIGDDE